MEEESSLDEPIKNRGAGVLPLMNLEQESYANATVNRQIPQIVVHPSDTFNDGMSEFLQNDTQQNEPEASVAAEPPAEKKGAIRALIK